MIELTTDGRAIFAKATAPRSARASRESRIAGIMSS